MKTLHNIRAGLNFYQDFYQAALWMHRSYIDQRIGFDRNVKVIFYKDTVGIGLFVCTSPQGHLKQWQTRGKPTFNTDDIHLNIVDKTNEYRLRR